MVTLQVYSYKRGVYGLGTLGNEFELDTENKFATGVFC